MFSVARRGPAARVENFVRAPHKRRLVSRLTSGKRKERLGTRGQQQLAGRAQPGVDPLSAQQGDHVEQTRAYRFSRKSHTYGMYEHTGLDAARLGDGAERGF